MSDRVQFGRYAWLCVFIFTVALGCTDNGMSNRPLRVSYEQRAIDFESVPLVPNPPLVLHNVSRVMISSPEVGLSLVKGLAVDAQRNVYVADWLLHGVPVINPHGELVKLIGRQGSGPGEFRSIVNVEVLSDGKLLVYDPQQLRITVFYPGGDSVMRSISVMHGPQKPYLSRVQVAGNTNAIMVGVYGWAYTQNTINQERPDIVRTSSMAGIILDSIISIPHKENLKYTTLFGGGVATHPFGRRGFIRVGGNNIYYGWTDTVGVRTYSLTGEFTGGFKTAYERAAVTSDDVDQAMKELDNRWEQLALRENIPETWPAFENFIVDDRGRVWFGIVEEGGITSRWDGFTPDGEYVGSLEFSPNFNLKIVRGNRAYGVRTNELDVPRIEVYRIEWVDPAEVTLP